MDCDDVLVDDGGGGPGLAGESLAGRAAGGELGCENLDRDHPVQRRVMRFEHDSHAPATQYVIDRVRTQAAELARAVGRGEEVESFVIMVES